MAITTTYGNPRYGDQVTTVNFEGRVVSVDQVNERRNWSDTLDYSDWRMTDCTIATVYLGRYGAKDAYDRYDAATMPPERYEALVADKRRSPLVELPAHERFLKVDVTNMWSWRTGKVDAATVDADDTTYPELNHDYAEYMAHIANERKRDEERRRAREEAELAERIREEENRPVIGKKMIVARGRKVKVGTVGTVAFVRDGSVLLKPDATYTDRKVGGVWVQAHNLELRRPCTAHEDCAASPELGEACVGQKHIHLLNWAHQSLTEKLWVIGWGLPPSGLRATP
jgi:hypothetical protein